MAAICKIGNSLGVILPSHAAKQLGLKLGTKIRLFIGPTQIVLENASQPVVLQNSGQPAVVSVPLPIEVDDPW